MRTDTVCRKCGDTRGPYDFPGGAHPCRPCRAARQREWRASNQARSREINRQSRRRHPETERQYSERCPERRILKGMVNRCHNPNSAKYASYGARGITVCGEWRGPGGFDAFFAYIGPRPTPEHSIDRIDNDRGYEPGNVRWATRAEQARNTRQTRRLSAAPAAKCLKDAADIAGLGEATVRRRLRLGWGEEKALAAPVAGHRHITVDGVTKTATEWSVDLGGSPSLVSRRIHDGWDPVDAASAPLGQRRSA